jgi:hypothetical protein
MAEDNGKSASEMGYEVRQLTGGDQFDSNSTMGGVPHNPNSRADGDVQARELAENDVAREARRKIIAIMEEDEPPRHAPNSATGRVRPKNPGMNLNDLMEGLTAEDLTTLGGGLNDVANSAAVDLFQSGYMGDDNEAAQLAESMAGRPKAPAEPTWDWRSTKAAATLRNGKTVPVWTVENVSNGMSMNKPFRVQAPAERIASLLNVTGNVNDPRIQQIHEQYDQYVSLSRQYRKAKQLHESGDQNAGKSEQRIVVQLRGIKQQLGIG